MAFMQPGLKIKENSGGRHETLLFFEAGSYLAS
jgi:hypothetical protein